MSLNMMIETLEKEGALYLTIMGKVDDPPVIIKKNDEGKYCYNTRQFISPSLAVLTAIDDQGGLHRILSYDSEEM